METRYTAEHEWVELEGELATVGITDHAQNALGDLVFVQLPAVGATLARGAAAAVVESVKAASDIYAPLSGTVTEVNVAAVEDPSVVNRDPRGAGWLFRLRTSDPAERSQLLDEAGYRQVDR